MLSPLHKTVQMKCIATFFLASCSRILFDNFHLTNRAQVLWFIIFFFLLFLHDDSGHSIPSAFEKIRDLVRVDDPIGNYISQLFVRIFVLEKQLAVCGQIKNLGEDVNSVQAMKLFFGSTWALKFVADGDFKFISMSVFENKTGSTRNANQIELLFSLEFLEDELRLSFGNGSES